MKIIFNYSKMNNPSDSIFKISKFSDFELKVTQTSSITALEM